jgi:hypothetical protein
MEKFLNFIPITYYPSNKYIPYESTFNKLNVDLNNKTNKTINELDNIKTNEFLLLYIEYKYINKNLFDSIKQLDISNLIIPNNVIFIIHNNNSNINVIWSSIQNEKIYKKFILKNV